MSGVIFRSAMRTAKSVAARAIWINRPIFLSSFFSTQCRGSKSRTSPAMVQSNPVGSNWVMARMPLFPARRFFQTSSVPIPRPQTNPTPVTTTRRLTAEILLMTIQRLANLLLGAVFLDVVDSVLYGGNFLGVLVRNFNPKGLFKGHHKFDRI